jgi:hypothetical protein
MARHVSPAELAQRLGVQPCTLAAWRVVGAGPRYIKFGQTKQARVVYPLAEVEAWEADHLQSNTGAIPNA